MNSICIILVEPKGAMNIGSICRSMMNFGLSELRLVNPRTDYNSEEVKRIALKGSSVLGNIRIFSSLFQAVEDCGLILGTTRRFGKHRIKQYFLSPRKAAKKILPFLKFNKVAYVFGREDMGLFNDELKICNSYVTIPTSSLYKSINLSHAVSICLYELHKEYQKFTPTINNIEVTVAKGRDILEMINQMKKILQKIGYLSSDNPEHITKALCRIFVRSKLNTREIRIIQGLWSRINWINKQIKN